MGGISVYAYITAVTGGTHSAFPGNFIFCLDNPIARCKALLQYLEHLLFLRVLLPLIALNRSSGQSSEDSVTMQIGFELPHARAPRRLRLRQLARTTKAPCATSGWRNPRFARLPAGAAHRAGSRARRPGVEGCTRVRRQKLLASRVGRGIPMEAAGGLKRHAIGNRFRFFENLVGKFSVNIC